MKTQGEYKRQQIDESENEESVGFDEHESNDGYILFPPPLP